MFWKNKKYEDLYWKYKESTQEDNWKHIRTRLYFTSASHMYSIINVICLGNNRELLKCTPPNEAEKAINQLYMSYLSHIEFRLYENMVAEENDSHRFRLEISISS
jgi:inositol hexakisphosphate/diphosphoinositol-pentakisphosphate kinase